MEVALGPLLVIAVLLVLFGAKRGAETAQRERQRRWGRLPAPPADGRPLPPQRVTEVEVAPVAAAGARAPSSARRAAPTTGVAEQDSSGGTSEEAVSGRGDATARTAGSPSEIGTVRRVRSALAARTAPPEPKPSDRPLAVAPRPTPPIDVNAASAEELRNLPGVGIRAAERIVAHRKRHGPFVSVDDIEAVEGFDHHRVSRLAPRAKV